MSEQESGARRRPPGIGEGVRTGVGILSAFRDAIEETIRETMENSDTRPERARELLNDALARAQDALGEVRERLDVVPRRDFDALRAEVAELRRRLDALEGRAPPPASPLILPASTGTTDVAPGEPGGGEGPLEGRMP